VIPNTVSVIGGKIKTLVIPIGGSIVHVCNSAQLRAIQSAIPTASISLQNSHVTTTEDNESNTWWFNSYGCSRYQSCIRHRCI